MGWYDLVSPLYDIGSAGSGRPRRAGRRSPRSKRQGRQVAAPPLNELSLSVIQEQ